MAAIKGRGDGSSRFLDALEAKYGGGAAPKRGAKKRSEPTDEDFAAAQARVATRKKR